MSGSLSTGEAINGMIDSLAALFERFDAWELLAIAVGLVLLLLMRESRR